MTIVKHFDCLARLYISHQESHFGERSAEGYGSAIPCQQVNVMGSYTETI